MARNISATLLRDVFLETKECRGDFRREKADFGEGLIIRKETTVLHVDDDDET